MSATDSTDATDSVHGTVADGYEPVRAQMRLLAERHAAAALAAYRHGRLVVDLVFGAPPEALWHTWSTVKPVTGTCLLVVAAEHGLALDTPVRRVWPTLAAARDGRMTLRHLLGHAAGLVSLGSLGTARRLIDWHDSIAALERHEPDWVPGTAVGEHAFTFGHLVGEVIRRVDGRSTGHVLRAELAGPLELDLHLGLDDAHAGRVRDSAGLDRDFWHRTGGPPGSLRRRALGPGIDDATVNSTAWRGTEVPAVNGHASARALAAFYAHALAGALPAGVAEPAATGHDRVLGRDVVWTQAGGQLDGGRLGMGGIGGQYAGAHPESGLAWAFLTAQMTGAETARRFERVLHSCPTSTVAHIKRGDTP